jgi:hypothetical protein
MEGCRQAALSVKSATHFHWCTASAPRRRRSASLPAGSQFRRERSLLVCTRRDA